MICEGIAEGLPTDKPQGNPIDQLIQSEHKRHRLDRSEMLAMVALLVMIF
jgi:hypothetical protein